MAKWVYINPTGGRHFHQEGCLMVDEDYLKVPFSILTGRVYIHPHLSSYQSKYEPCPGCMKKERRLSRLEASELQMKYNPNKSLQEHHGAIIG